MTFSVFVLLIYSIVITGWALYWRRQIPPRKDIWEDKEMRIEIERFGKVTKVDVFVHGSLFKVFTGSAKERVNLGESNDDSEGTRFN